MRFASRFLPALLLLAAPAPLAADDSVSLQVAARNVGNAIARRPVGPDEEEADKLIAFVVKDGQLGVGAMVALEPNTQFKPQIEDGTIALLRTREAGRTPRAEPDAIDIALARSVNVPVYVVGEWSKPPAIWEISASADSVNWRIIDESGLAGPWYEIIE